MPVHKIISTPDTIEIWTSAKNAKVTINRKDFTGSLAAIEASILVTLQDGLDAVIPLSELSVEDPDKTINKGSEKEFYDGTNLVHRGVIVNSVSWIKGLPCVVSLSRAKD